MNIAEIRKKTKKKKAPADVVAEMLPELPEESAPLAPAEEPVPEAAAQEAPIGEPQAALVPSQPGGDLQLIDEENLYMKHSEKDDRDLNEFLCFRLGNEEYGIDITIAREIIKSREVTVVPRTVDFIIGIISIRGEIVPVFDIKKLLGIETDQIAVGSKFIILSYSGEMVGICVDSITQITKIPLGRVEATPLNISGAKHELIRGIAIIDSRMIRILDIEKILNF